MALEVRWCDGVGVIVVSGNTGTVVAPIEDDGLKGDEDEEWGRAGDGLMLVVVGVSERSVEAASGFSGDIGPAVSAASFWPSADGKLPSPGYVVASLKTRHKRYRLRL